MPNKLNAQLEEDTQRFINNPDKVRYDADNNILYCSKIFDWYAKDFLAQSDSVISYIQPYLKDIKIPADATVEYLPYSWQLNQRTSS